MFLNHQDALYMDKSNSNVLTQIKTKIYVLMHELSQSQSFLPIVYKLLLLIETFQFLWWTLYPREAFLWSYEVFNWIIQFLKYFQLDGPLLEDNKSLFAATVYTVFALQVIVLLIIIANFIFIRKTSLHKSNSTLVNQSGKILSIYSIFLTTILPLPLYSTFITAFICFPEDSRHGDLECYTGTYWVYIILSCIGVIILTITSFIANLLFIDLNPWSDVPFAAPQSRLNLIKLAFKILIPLFSSLDYKAEHTKVFIILYGVIWLIILGIRYKQTPYYHRSIFTFAITLEMFIFWTIIIVLFHTMSENQNLENTGFIFWLVISPFVCYSYVTLVRRRPKVYRKLKLKNLTKDSEVEMYIMNLINLIEGRENHHKRTNLEGLLKYHTKNCTKKAHECNCLDLITNYNNEEEAPEKVWYTWIKNITTEALEKFPKSVKLHLLYAFLLREKLDNKFKALFELMIALDAKPSFEEEFAIFKYKNIIEDEIIENDLKHIESKGIDVNLIVDFENKFVDFQTAIETAVESHLDFWRELLENNPEIQKLQTLGSYITKSLEEAEKQYQQLCVINSNHVRMLKIYGNFLKEVVNDENEGQRILDRAEQVDKSSVANRQFLDDEKLKYGDNANPCIVTCSANFTTMGIILNANNEIYTLLGYTKSEMLGQNISQIMPKALSDEHDNIMMNYFETAKNKVYGKERVVFPVNKQGYLLPCTLMIKVLPSLSEGLKIVGFLTELEREAGNIPDDIDKSRLHYVMYDGHTGSIQGVTANCKRNFGISGSLIRTSSMGTNDFTIDAIFPEILQLNIDDLKNLSGVITTINTATLKENYMIEHENSNEEDLDDQEHREEETNAVYRMTQVSAVMTHDEDYNEFNLRVIRFIEMGDENVSASQYPIIESVGQVTKPTLRSDVMNSKIVGAEDEGEKSGNGASEELDSSAAGAEFNEDIRLLKDFKTLISEKTVPKSIKILRNAVILFGLIFITLTSLSLSFNMKQTSEFQSGVVSINMAYKRIDVVGNIVWKLRKLQNIATELYQESTPALTNATEAKIRSELFYLIDNLRNLTLRIGENEDKISKLGFPLIEYDSVVVQSMTQLSPKTGQSLFSDSINQFSSHATAAVSALREQFITNNPTDSTKSSFFFVNRNGLFPIRVKSDTNAQLLHDFYHERTQKYTGNFRIILIIALAVLVICEFILVPIVFSVHKTATKVLSLFGYITTSEISNLATKCEVYMDTYLEHRREHQRYGEEEEEQEIENDVKPSKTSRFGQNYLEVGQHGGEDPNNSHLDMSHSFRDNENHEENERGKSSAKSKGDVILSPQSANVSLNEKSALGSKNISDKIKEDEKKAQEAEEEAEQGNARSQKLLNSKDNNRGKVIFQFSFFVALIAAYFIADYVTGTQQQNNIRKGMNHLEMLSSINPDFRYMTTFTLEEIVVGSQNDLYTFADVLNPNQRTAYKTKSLTDAKRLADSSQGSYPSQFNDYVESYNLYSSGDVCQNYYGGNLTHYNDCLSIGGQLLTKGISLGQTRMTQMSDDIVNAYTNNPNKQLIISGDDTRQLESLMDTISPVIQTLEKQMMSSFADYLDYIDMVSKVKFSIFIVAIFVLFFVIWSPYLRQLKEKIFRTKGMLNMIPMNIITKNENLKSVFIQGNILQAVK